MEGLENTADKKQEGGMWDGGIGEHRGQINRQGWGDEEWRDWRTQGTKNKQGG